MKKIIIGLLLIALVASLLASRMIIHRVEGHPLAVDIQNIERITFDGQALSMLLVQGTDGVDFGSTQGEGYFNPGSGNGGDYHVFLSSFYISRYEVTQSEYLSVMGNNPSGFSGDNNPVESVSWFDAIEYCNRLSIIFGLKPCYSYMRGDDYGTNPDDWPDGWNTDNENRIGIICNWEANGYRLPTEMEWEFAARGGVPAQNAGTFDDRWAGTDDEDEVGDYAWYSDNSDNRTHPVGTKFANELGLYDMSGNVGNWVWNRYRRYSSRVSYDPKGPRINSDFTVKRSGSWNNSARWSSVYTRHRTYTTSSNHFVGFRVVRTVQ